MHGQTTLKLVTELQTLHISHAGDNNSETDNTNKTV